jgi:hypothetical protein
VNDQEQQVVDAYKRGYGRQVDEPDDDLARRLAARNISIDQAEQLGRNEAAAAGQQQGEPPQGEQGKPQPGQPGGS